MEDIRDGLRPQNLAVPDLYDRDQLLSQRFAAHSAFLQSSSKLVVTTGRTSYLTQDWVREVEDVQALSLTRLPSE